jgi:phospholipid-transporting ATPase
MQRQASASARDLSASKIIIFQYISYTWADVQVGDLVYIEENDSFPADLVVLGSSIESGACYIETSSLDGEKNLKNKSALFDTQILFNDYSAYSNDEFYFEAKEPT